jgi:hypothetical protein
MNDHLTRAQYLEKFPAGDVRKEALKQALDIRKFEIELYWKRATYFWTFIAAALGAYFALQSQREPDLASVYIVSCLGFTFSLAWYGVNRGSGAWQRNWEAHVDLLEDEIMGPLYKTLINRRTYKLYDLAEPYSFSPSRINNLLALLVTGSWLILLVRTLAKIGATIYLTTDRGLACCQFASLYCRLHWDYPPLLGEVSHAQNRAENRAACTR